MRQHKQIAANILQIFGKFNKSNVLPPTPEIQTNKNEQIDKQKKNLSSRVRSALFEAD